MIFTRRGFLGTMFAAATAAVANFDPLKGLWVPGHALADAPQPTVIIPAATWTKSPVDVQLELNALAEQFATVMSPRLAASHTTILRRVMLQHAGHSDLGLIQLTDDDGAPAGRGRFEPAPHRIAKDVEVARGWTVDKLEGAADQMHRDVRAFDTYAPIGTHLREGVPFADCLVGVGTDKETGLTARALRFRTADGIVHTECELAVGDWWGKGRKAKRHKGQTARIFSLPPEQVEAQEAIWQAHGNALATPHEHAWGDDDKHEFGGSEMGLKEL